MQPARSWILATLWSNRSTCTAVLSARKSAKTISDVSSNLIIDHHNRPSAKENDKWHNSGGTHFRVISTNSQSLQSSVYLGCQLGEKRLKSVSRSWPFKNEAPTQLYLWDIVNAVVCLFAVKQLVPSQNNVIHKHLKAFAATCFWWAWRIPTQGSQPQRKQSQLWR